MKKNGLYMAGHTGYTWRRGKTQSRLDRFLIRLALYSIKKTIIKLDTN